MLKIKIMFVFLLVFFLSYLIFRNFWNQDAKLKLPSWQGIFQALFTKSQNFGQDVCRAEEGAVLTAGPYIFLVNGGYKVEYLLRGEGKVFLDVISKGAEKDLASREVVVSSKDVAKEELFFVTKGGRDHEFRAFSQSKNEICFFGLKLEVVKRDWRSFILTLPARLGRLIYFWIFPSNV